ncbi:unnamed protein product [Prorocentrum cordatum]|uniref:Uncharacterized protein n=1 Tax=Prorocentrum cordatum TaxID=2364126 RepID=A0ABN9UDB1_9DINO|nr:unnamed protein product [Polarella glacialis]
MHRSQAPPTMPQAGDAGHGTNMSLTAQDVPQPPPPQRECRPLRKLVEGTRTRDRGCRAPAERLRSQAALFLTFARGGGQEPGRSYTSGDSKLEESDCSAEAA